MVKIVKEIFKKRLWIVGIVLGFVILGVLTCVNYTFYLKIKESQKKIGSFDVHQETYQEKARKLEDLWNGLKKIETGLPFENFLEVYKPVFLIYSYQFLIFYLSEKYPEYEITNLKNFSFGILKADFKIDEKNFFDVSKEIKEFPLFSQVVCEEKKKKKGQIWFKCLIYLKS